MRTRLVAAGLALSFVVGSSWGWGQSGPSLNGADGVRQGPVTARSSAPVIEFAGGPVEIGSRHAAELSGPIKELFEKYLKPFFKSDAQRFIALGAAAMFEARVSPEHREEIKALAAASKLDEREVMLAQCFLDLQPNTACSTITLPGSASADGVARFGRNLDFPGKGIADKQSVVMIYRPDGGRYGFAAVSWPGLTGVLSGMNEYGLALANMELPRARRVPTAMPYILLYRSVLERCRTVAEAVEFLEKTPRQSANNLMLMDASGERALVEISPEKVVVRRANETEPLVSTNHTRGTEAADQMGRCRRYDALWNGATSGFGKLDVDGVEKLLASAGQGSKTLQSMVFEPSTLTLYLSTGERAYQGPFEKLELKKYFAAK